MLDQGGKLWGKAHANLMRMGQGAALPVTPKNGLEGTK